MSGRTSLALSAPSDRVGKPSTWGTHFEIRAIFADDLVYHRQLVQAPHPRYAPPNPSSSHHPLFQFRQRDRNATPLIPAERQLPGDRSTRFGTWLLRRAGRAEQSSVTPADGQAEPSDIIFVRHAETIANATGRYSSSTTNTFTAKGSRQKDDLVAKLIPTHPVRVICSPIPRCRMTIAPFLNEAGLKAEIWPELAECCWQKDRVRGFGVSQWVSGSVNDS